MANDTKSKMTFLALPGWAPPRSPFTSREPRAEATRGSGEHPTMESSLLMAMARCWASMWGMSFWITWSVMPWGNWWHSSMILGEERSSLGTKDRCAQNQSLERLSEPGRKGSKRTAQEEVRTKHFSATATEETRRPAPLPTKPPLHLMAKRPQLSLTVPLLHLTFRLLSTATHRAPPLPASPAPQSLSRGQGVRARARPSAPALYIHGVGHLRLHLHLRHDGGPGCTGRWRHRARREPVAEQRVAAARWDDVIYARRWRLPSSGTRTPRDRPFVKKNHRLLFCRCSVLEITAEKDDGGLCLSAAGHTPSDPPSREGQAPDRQRHSGGNQVRYELQLCLCESFSHATVWTPPYCRLQVIMVFTILTASLK